MELNKIELKKISHDFNIVSSRITRAKFDDYNLVEYSCAAEPPVQFEQSHHSRSESHQKCYAAKGSLYE